MKTINRRIGVASVAAAVVAGAFSTSQAGVIPWIYDAIFGPAYYSPYAGPYAPMSYSAGYWPSSCGPSGCRVSCGPCASPCSTGKCSPVVAYCNPCEVSSTKCDTNSPNWKAGETPTKANIKTEVRTPTFSPTKPDYRDDANGPDVDPKTGERILKKPVTEATEFSAPTNVEPGSANSANGFKKTPAADIDTGFEPAPIGEEKFPAPKKPAAATPADDDVKPLNLESKATWSVTPAIAHQRSTRKATFRDASIARRTIEVPATSPATPNRSAIVKK